MIAPVNASASRSLPNESLQFPARDLPDADEARLVERLRAGDDEAYEELVRRFGARLLATARHFLPRTEDAQDAVQDAFLSAFRSLDRFRGGCRLSTWLHRIVINAALMKLRGASRRPETPIEDYLPRFDETGHHAAPVEEWTVSPEGALLSRETSERVRAAIEALPVSYRTVLILRDIEERSTEETAEILSVTRTAVKVRLHRARLALRTLLVPVFSARSVRVET
ncbi:MAG TPA: sigma-70 family RNA polymerase sigma factor [Thermoanaerobaculia bacterium]|nr:sigma-70 family RNA polymerase sigma factor [Thermoanaerobaculia bacterium]